MITKTAPLFIASCLAGYILSLLHMPLPWTLGPLAASACWVVFIKSPVYWPKKLRNWGMVLLGYVMGSPFTLEVGHHMLQQFPIILLITIMTIAFCLLAGYITGRYSGIGLTNSMIGSLPGGLSQMSVICEGVPGTNASIVTLMQTIRVITVVIVVPFLTLHGLAETTQPVITGTHAFVLDEMPQFALFIMVIIVLIQFQKHFNLPNPYIIAPLVGTATLVLSGISAPVLPSYVIAGAQVFIGIRIGIDVASTSIDSCDWKKIICFNILSVVAVIVLLLGTSYIFSHIYTISLMTAFISVAPGGMSEMALTAMMVKADLPTVVTYQLFRLLFLLLVCVPLLQWWLNRRLSSPSAKNPITKE